MPQIFKALATIMAWTLWISSWLTAFFALFVGITAGAFSGSEPPPMVMPVFILVALAQAVSAVVIMRLRQKME